GSLGPLSDSQCTPGPLPRTRIPARQLPVRYEDRRTRQKADKSCDETSGESTYKPSHRTGDTPCRLLAKHSVGVEKVRQHMSSRLRGCHCRVFLFSVRLSGGCQNRCCWLAEEA